LSDAPTPNTPLAPIPDGLEYTMELMAGLGESKKRKPATGVYHRSSFNGFKLEHGWKWSAGSTSCFLVIRHRIEGNQRRVLPAVDLHHMNLAEIVLLHRGAT